MKKKKVAIIGGNGQLGSDLQKVFSGNNNYEVYPLTHSEIEITQENSVKKIFDKIQPTIIINTAAYTRVDEAEGNPEKAFLINSIGTKNVAQYCKKNNIELMLISSDYVFGLNNTKKSPYVEDDIPGPINTYGISKLAGEYYVQSLLSSYYIVRTTGLFGVAGSSGKGYNFIELMIRLATEKKKIQVVDDQIMTPTYTQELAYQIEKILMYGKYGIYHATAEGECSWYLFAKEIFKQLNISADVEKVKSSHFPTPAKRPSYSVLENQALKIQKIHIMKSWQDELHAYLTEKNLI